MNKIGKYRFLIVRRILQLGIIFLFYGAAHWGWSILKGNLSAAHVADTFYLVDPFAVVQMLFAGQLPAWDLLSGALIIFFIYAFVAGRSFCSWVCPVNIITDTAFWLRNKLGLHSGFLKFDRSVRYWILGLSLILSMILGVAAFEFISPISVLHRGLIFGMGTGWFVVVMIFLGDLFAKKNAWCGHLCPLGAFYSTISSKAALKIYHEKESCTSCWDCKKVCPEVQVLGIIAKKDGVISSGECTNCGRCIESCGENALKFTFLKRNHE